MTLQDLLEDLEAHQDLLEDLAHLQDLEAPLLKETLEQVVTNMPKSN